MLDHIHIENFRLFKNLDIPKVGQVNLITGKNNSGKTTLLEALRIHAVVTAKETASAFFLIDSVVYSILRERGDLNGDILSARQSLFHDKNTNLPIRINYETEITFKSKNKGQLMLKDGDSQFEISYEPTTFMSKDSRFIPANFELSNVRLWQKIELTEKEDKVLEVLHIIEPNIERISVSEADGTAKVRLKDSPKPLPLKNFGEGMNRLLTVALGLVSAENDMLLIDEIDLGLHHSVQRLLWEIVFQKAKDLNVQVFATTHSSDCVQAFSDVANKPEYAGMGNYIRLQRSKKDGDIVAVDYEMEVLESAIDLNLETR